MSLEAEFLDDVAYGGVGAADGVGDGADGFSGGIEVTYLLFGLRVVPAVPGGALFAVCAGRAMVGFRF
ncbi:MAG: hypothetical protein CK431_10040 [Mycobacterium sp.]|nr:MAG: hypothetical protein CK431_10040 [Mycobacterium sp.]